MTLWHHELNIALHSLKMYLKAFPNVGSRCTIHAFHNFHNNFCLFALFFLNIFVFCMDVLGRLLSWNIKHWIITIFFKKLNVWWCPLPFCPLFVDIQTGYFWRKLFVKFFELLPILTYFSKNCHLAQLFLKLICTNHNYIFLNKREVTKLALPVLLLGPLRKRV